MNDQVEVKLRGEYVKVMLDQLERQAKNLVMTQKAPGMAIEMAMAQFIAAGMFVARHVGPAMVEDLFKDLMTNRAEIEKAVADKTETMINNAIKEVTNGAS